MHSSTHRSAFLRRARAAAHLVLALVWCASEASSQTVDSFNPDPSGEVFVACPEAPGSILVGGLFTNVAGSIRYRLGRLKVNGTLASGMQVGVNNEVYALARQDDGKLIAGGNFSQFRHADGTSGASCSCLARFDAADNPDPTFKGYANGFVTGLIVQSDNKILITGGFSSLCGSSVVGGFGRLEADGQLDSNFMAMVRPLGAIRCVALQNDGKILAGGPIQNPGGAACTNLSRLHPDGRLDETFHEDFGGSVECIAVQPDGKILVSGFRHATPPGVIMRLNPDGSRDTTFSPQSITTGPADPGMLRSIALQADGKAVIAGDFTMVGSSLRTNLARLNPDGSVDAGFKPRVGRVYSLAVQPDGAILVAGGSWYLGDQTRKFVGRLMNTDLATEAMRVSPTDILWELGGSSPVFTRVAFSSSLNRVDWTPLGEASPVATGWRLSGVAVPPGEVIRARGYVAGAYQNGSSWYWQITVGPHEWPRIVTDDGQFGLASGRFEFNVSGPMDWAVVVERSPDLSSWSPVTTNTLRATPFRFSDPAPDGTSALFYRLRW